MTASFGAAPRQAAILALIAGLHAGAVLLGANGLNARFGWLEPPPPYFYLLPASAELPPVPPHQPEPVDYGLPSQPEPQVPFPDFEDARTPGPESRTDAGAEAGSGAAAPDVQAPSLRMRGSRMAALLDACYPSASRRAGEEGRAVVQVRIDAAGRVGAWSIVERSAFTRLDAALDCVVRRLEFVPGRHDGEAVAASAILPIVFRLD